MLASFRWKMRLSWLSLSMMSAMIVSACVPPFLEKYRQAKSEDELQASVDETAAQSEDDGRKKSRARERLGIVMLDSKKFKVYRSYDRTWEAIITVLLHNYNLALADRSGGLITTEWDSYYLEEKLFRNKMSIRLKRLGESSVELLVHNNVEELRNMGSPQAVEQWLPSPLNLTEVGRVMQNLAITLNLPKPNLPKEMLATRVQPAGSHEAAARL